MKRSLWISLLCMGLALVVILFAYTRVDGEKENVVISQEVLSGDPAAAEGVSLRIASHWNGHLLWDTKYRIGSGNGAESDFTFSAKQVAWEWESYPSARAHLPYGYGGSFGTAMMEEDLPEDPQMPFFEIIQAVAGRTEKGETREETLRIGDYREYYPVDFELEGTSVEYQGDYVQVLTYLTELFRIPVAEDRIGITVEKNLAGDSVSCKQEQVRDAQSIQIADAWAFGKTGVYYGFCLENAGRRACRGENSGLFYLPFEARDGWIRVDLMQMEKVCTLPEEAVLQGLLLEEEKGRLYATVKGENDYELLIYDLGDGTPGLTQTLALGQERLFLTQEDNSLYLPDIDFELELLPTGLIAMSREDGGLLMTWSDNGFSFVTETKGEHQLWCSGRFPRQSEEEYVGTGHGWRSNNLFPMERECLFDGERLVLAAFEDWDSLNVLLAVYDREGETYSGLYRYVGDSPGYFSYESYQTGVQPQGRDSLSFLEERILADVYVRGTGEEVKALELQDR